MLSPRQSSSDYVYPTHMMDNLSMLREMIMVWTMRFDEILDPEKLHNSLTELLRIGDWKKLGGRFKYGDNPQGHLEIHSTTPAVAFWHNTYDISIEEHQLSQSFPEATDEPSVHPISSKFWDSILSPDTPKTLKDSSSRDVPILALPIVLFDDATIASISRSHLFFDTKGFYYLVEACSNVLSDHKENVPDIVGARGRALQHRR